MTWEQAFAGADNSFLAAALLGISGISVGPMSFSHNSNQTWD